MSRTCSPKRSSPAGIRSPVAWVTALVLVLLLPGAAPVAAGITKATLTGDLLEAVIELPGGGEIELSILFEDASGLTVKALGLSATEVDPADPAITARLPASTSLPAALPFILRIEPSPGVSLKGVTRVSFYTHDLSYQADSPLRVFSAPIGGAFRDVTESGGPGSYRGGATTPRFETQMLVAEDERPRHSVASIKLDRLAGALTGALPFLDPLTQLVLSGLVDTVETALALGDYVLAVTTIETLIDVVALASGVLIPDVWVAGGSAVNVAGELRSEAWTLRYTLLQLANGLE